MDRVRFANQLRGLAALGVACSHLIGVYWVLPDVVSSVSASPPQVGAFPSIFWLVANPWFNLGPFGVGVFFLISGMVVPFSIDRHSRVGFIAARLLRIYPTYAVALLLETAAVWASARLWDRPLPFGPALLAGNITLVYDLIGQPSIDLVNWTLSVEIKFYLLIVLLASLIRRANAPALIAAAGLICAANGAVAAGWIGDINALPSTLTYTFSSHSLCLIFMLIGTLFNFHLRGKLGTAGLAGAIAILFVLFVITWLLGVWRAQFPIVTANYGLALILFTLLYTVRRYIPRNRVLDAMAAISFPFYVLHSLLGYVLLRAGMVGLHLPYYPALSITVLLILAASLALHRLVEKPTQRLGRHLGQRADSAVPSQTAMAQRSSSASDGIAAVNPRTSPFCVQDAVSRNDRPT